MLRNFFYEYFYLNQLDYNNLLENELFHFQQLAGIRLFLTKIKKRQPSFLVKLSASLSTKATMIIIHFVHYN